MGEFSFAGGNSLLGLWVIQEARSGFCVLGGFSSTGLLMSVTGNHFGFGPSISTAGAVNQDAIVP